VFRNGQIKNRVAELTWIVDMLHAAPGKQSLLWGDMLANRFDTSRVALGGHSFGGATVLCHAAVDTRIRCVFTNDAWLVPAHPSVVASGVPNIPVMLLVSNQWLQWTEHMQTLNDFFAKCVTAGSVFMGIKDSRHSNFDDVSMFSPVCAVHIILLNPC
jgi:platelet-activating factor acetylhydrolase